jgi:hypothetical protein
LASNPNVEARPPFECATRIYFVQAPSVQLIKIGVATNLQGRFWALRSASPVPLLLLAFMPGTKEDEKCIHRSLWHSRSHGEWFRDNAEVGRYVTKATEFSRHLPIQFANPNARLEKALQEVRKVTCLGLHDAMALLVRHPQITLAVHNGRYRDAAKLIGVAMDRASSPAR